MRYAQLKHILLSRTIAIACAAFIVVADLQAADSPPALPDIYSAAYDPAVRPPRSFVVLNRGSTLGMGTEVSMNLNSKLNIRFGFDRLHDIERQAKGNIYYKLDVKFRSMSLLLDWRPSHGPFRTSVGILVNGSRLRVDAIPTGTLSPDSDDPADMALAALLFGTTDPTSMSIKASDLLTANAKVSFRSIAPYIGVGWSNSLHSNRRLLYTVDIGVAFYGSPEVNLGVAGSAVNLAGRELQALLASEEKQLERELKDYDVFPVVSFGLLYRF